MISLNDINKLVLIVEIQCLLCDVERNFHTQFYTFYASNGSTIGIIICFSGRVGQTLCYLQFSYFCKNNG
jgi:hypothetical protein